MKQTILVFAILLLTFTASYAQTTLRIVNNNSCDIEYLVIETGTTGTCSLTNVVGTGIISAGSFVDIVHTTTSMEFEVTITNCWATGSSILPVYTDLCGPQIEQNPAVPACAWACPVPGPPCPRPNSLVTAEVVSAMPPADRQVNVY